METNHPNNSGETDAEYEAIKDKIPGLRESTPAEEEHKEEVKTPEEEAAEAEAAQKKADDDAAAEAKKKEEDDAAAKAAAESGDEGDQTPARPQRYIPIKQYTDEKKDWKQREAELLKDLEEAKASKGPEKNEAITAYAEKHGVTEESVRELLALSGSGDKKQEAQAEAIIDDTIKAALEEGEQLKAEKLFAEEFEKSALPKLKTLYPDASAKQLADAKKEIERIACTEAFLKTPLDKVVLASQEDLGSFFKPATRQGPETGRPAPKREGTTYTAEDFKGGKTDFKELLALPSAEQGKIVEGMDMATYEAFTRYNDRNDNLVIHRGGKRVGSS